MKSLDRNDFAPYTDVYTEYCPHCGVRFYTDRVSDVFHDDKCYRQHYSLLQRSPFAVVLKGLNLPIQREWALRTKEKLHIYLWEVIRTSDELAEIQDFPVIRKFMNIHGIERRFKKQKSVSQLKLFVPPSKDLWALILVDIKEVVDYPPAFRVEENVDCVLEYLIEC